MKAGLSSSPLRELNLDNNRNLPLKPDLQGLPASSLKAFQNSSPLLKENGQLNIPTYHAKKQATPLQLQRSNTKSINRSTNKSAQKAQNSSPVRFEESLRKYEPIPYPKMKELDSAEKKAVLSLVQPSVLKRSISKISKQKMLFSTDKENLEDSRRFKNLFKASQSKLSVNKQSLGKVSIAKSTFGFSERFPNLPAPLSRSVSKVNGQVLAKRGQSDVLLHEEMIDYSTSFYQHVSKLYEQMIKEGSQGKEWKKDFQKMHQGVGIKKPFMMIYPHEFNQGPDRQRFNNSKFLVLFFYCYQQFYATEEQIDKYFQYDKSGSMLVKKMKLKALVEMRLKFQTYQQQQLIKNQAQIDGQDKNQLNQETFCNGSNYELVIEDESNETNELQNGKSNQKDINYANNEKEQNIGQDHQNQENQSDQQQEANELDLDCMDSVKEQEISQTCEKEQEEEKIVREVVQDLSTQKQVEVSKQSISDIQDLQYQLQQDIEGLIGNDFTSKLNRDLENKQSKSTLNLDADELEQQNQQEEIKEDLNYSKVIEDLEVENASIRNQKELLNQVYDSQDELTYNNQEVDFCTEKNRKYGNFFDNQRKKMHYLDHKNRRHHQYNQGFLDQFQNQNSSKNYHNQRHRTYHNQKQDSYHNKQQTHSRSICPSPIQPINKKTTQIPEHLKETLRQFIKENCEAKLHQKLIETSKKEKEAPQDINNRRSCVTPTLQLDLSNNQHNHNTQGPINNGLFLLKELVPQKSIQQSQFQSQSQQQYDQNYYWKKYYQSKEFLTKPKQQGVSSSSDQKLQNQYQQEKNDSNIQQNQSQLKKNNQTVTESLQRFPRKCVTPARISMEFNQQKSDQAIIEEVLPFVFSKIELPDCLKEFFNAGFLVYSQKFKQQKGEPVPEFIGLEQAREQKSDLIYLESNLLDLRVALNAETDKVGKLLSRHKTIQRDLESFAVFSLQEDELEDQQVLLGDYLKFSQGQRHRSRQGNEGTYDQQYMQRRPQRRVYKENQNRTYY